MKQDIAAHGLEGSTPAGATETTPHGCWKKPVFMRGFAVLGELFEAVKQIQAKQANASFAKQIKLYLYLSMFLFLLLYLFLHLSMGSSCCL